MVKIKSKNGRVTYLTEMTFLKFVSEVERPK